MINPFNFEFVKSRFFLQKTTSQLHMYKVESYSKMDFVKVRISFRVGFIESSHL